MIRPLFTIALACIAAPAFAQVPDYDTARRCTEFAKGNRNVENECRRNEADARRELEESRFPPEALASCNERVRAEQSYFLLYGCAASESEAKTDQRRASPIPVGPKNVPAPATPMNVPLLNSGPASRPAPPATRPGGITVMRGSEITVEKPSGR